ncbi:hypothetical protein RB195_014253 [Necator americanus]|uniref:Uncharacterized protein n=1 Tax=Necator americanus TaxID=51031 RepID=A0ABR1DZA7_NECAM
MRPLCTETLELIRQHGAARTVGNQPLMSELAKLCRKSIKKDLKERRAEVLAKATEVGKKTLATPVENSPIERRG